MKRFIIGLLEKITSKLKNEKKEAENQEIDFLPPETLETKSLQEPIEQVELLIQETYLCEAKKQRNKPKVSVRKTLPKNTLVEYVKDSRDIRDVMELMEIPFVSLSKKRTTPIVYESPNGKSKVKISCHPPYYLASIYDWDIIILISSKIQEIINSIKDAPSRTFIIPKHELFKEINKHNGKTSTKEIEAALNRLKSTLIETNVCNEDYRYRGGFGFIDSWGYTERNDIKEFKITLSEWLYELICFKGALLKVHPEYFKITSGLKRFLYRTARKHVGVQNESWELLVETLYNKSGSEREFKKFKHDLKKIVEENNLCGYFLKWVEKDNKAYVKFINTRKEVKKILAS